MRNIMVFGFMFLAVNCKAIEIEPGQTEPVSCKSPAPCPPAPTVTVTMSPEPAPTVTETVTASPLPAVTVTASPVPQPTVTVTASPKPCPVCPSPSPSVALLNARPLGTVPNSPFGYMEYLPTNYAGAANGTLPLIVHLHGIGERIGGQNGTTDVPLSRVANFGPYASYLKYHPEIQAVVLMPQAKKLSLWGSADVEAFIKMALLKYPEVNPKKVHLWGLSLGGFGVNSCMTRGTCASLLASAVAVCPGDMLSWTGSTNLVNAKIPYWLVHAEDDLVVTIQAKMDPSIKNLAGVLSWPQVTNRPDLPTQSTGYISSTGCGDAAQKKFVWEAGQSPNRNGALYCFTSYSQGGHGVWGRVYSDAQLYKWLEKVKP
jgi:predicted peptidase